MSGTITYTFRPNFETVARVQPTATIADMERERGVYSATPEFVRANCGPIARGLLDVVPAWYYQEAADRGLYPNIDVRVHRLYPGDYPAYPGWHCDGEYRETYFSQPDLDRIHVSRHLIATVSTHAGGVSNCQFLAQQLTATVDPPTSDMTLWGQVHRQVPESPPVVDTRDGDLVLFDSWSLHRVMPTKVRGWRLFFRMSMWHRPNLGAGGMLTKQEQVYKLVEGSGW
jgi:hypothetical protein